MKTSLRQIEKLDYLQFISLGSNANNQIQMDDHQKMSKNQVFVMFLFSLCFEKINLVTIAKKAITYRVSHS